MKDSVVGDRLGWRWNNNLHDYTTVRMKGEDLFLLTLTFFKLGKAINLQILREKGSPIFALFLVHTSASILSHISATSLVVSWIFSYNWTKKRRPNNLELRNKKRTTQNGGK